MELLHTVAGLWKTTGGPAASVPSLCRALGKSGHHVTLLTGEGSLAPEVLDAVGGISVRTANLGPYSMANFSLEFRRACRKAAETCHIIHTHGVWLHPNWTSAAAARWARKPLVISPRGMLEPWSLARSKWRKRALWRLREQRSFEQAALVHATSSGEAESVRRLGVTTPVAVIPNGVDLDCEFSAERLDRIRNGTGRLQAEPRKILFMGRIHPKKGLDLLLDAWSRLDSVESRARLVICGSGERGHVEALTARLKQMADDRIEYLGLVGGERKLELLTNAHVFVLPSWSENYGMAVAETLACRTPAITTTETPWQMIEKTRCGWWVQPEVDEIKRALEDALELSLPERLEMGERGRALIAERHSLARAAEMMEAAYSWVVDKTEKPDWVSDRDAA